MAGCGLWFTVELLKVGSWIIAFGCWAVDGLLMGALRLSIGRLMVSCFGATMLETKRSIKQKGEKGRV